MQVSLAHSRFDFRVISFKKSEMNFLDERIQLSQE